MEIPKEQTGTYIEAIGRRKTSIARVRLYEVKNPKHFTVNGKEADDYFATKTLQETIRQPLKTMGLAETFSVSVKVLGGGPSSQAEAIRLGVARALVAYNQELRKELKDNGFLKRDARVKERKKFGLKKARRAPQWSKR